MVGYWLQRRSAALAKAKSAPTPALAKVYDQLADYYLSLAQSAGVTPDGPPSAGDAD
ncbi:MAG: hypothetical protein M3N06_03520 [Pseudomonadota bacterium]|nr:hypothetical protein [Pseudomonadota bacterium]